jgi:hypothetical protein
MRAGGVALVQRALRVAVHRDLLQSAADDGAAAGRDLVDGLTSPPVSQSAYCSATLEFSRREVGGRGAA